DADHGTAALNPDAPSLVRINKNGDYEVFAVNNGVETKLGTADASTRGQNLLANLKADDGSLLYADVAKNPGFELNLSGTVKTGDEFNIELNLNGSADNSNGILLQNIEQKQIVNGNVSKTFSDAYSSVVSYIGTEVKVSDINHTAAKAKQSQSEALSQSSKGVELNEEASNLVRFQQSYQASARIITAAQSVFDSLMSALG
ncbi:MAG: flagellar basal body rod C-terminal domain-containing protein, partial [Succinivibrionaceae bacterium]|nr:flagellar basal body rod C-terminal domain-containing protein [Succinivibrionaceae bacterium]